MAVFHIQSFGITGRLTIAKAALLLATILIATSTNAFLPQQPILLHRRSCCQERNAELFYTTHSDSIATTTPTSIGSRNFQDRMKERVFRQQESAAAPKQKSKSIVNVLNLQQFKQEVGEETDRIVMVRFYAPWCRACKSMEPLWRQLAATVPNDKVKFVQVPATEENMNLHQGLGVPTLPYCHIYHPSAGLAEELRFTRKRVKNVANILKSYMKGECTDLQIDTDTDTYASPYMGE